MVVYAIVPVKRLGASKRRLSQSLSPLERRALTTAMLEDVLTALKHSVIEKVLVVSNDPKVRFIAQKFGADFFSPIRRGLNFAVEEAFAWCMKNKASSVLVLPADIPLITPGDINNIIELGNKQNQVVLVPSRDFGTNAFYQCPPHLIPAFFGPESFYKHIQEALKKGICVKFYYSLGTGLDIDSPEDLQLLKNVLNNTLSKQVLKKLKK